MKFIKYIIATIACLFLFAGESSAKSFKDVNKSSELGRAVDYMSEKNIISGYSDNTFRPNNNITRAQAAKIVAAAVNIEASVYKFPEIIEIDPEYFTPKPYKDFPLSHANFKAAYALKDAGIMNGYDDNTFKPNNNLTRAQIAKVLTLAYAIPIYHDNEEPNDWYLYDVKMNADSYPYVREMLNFNIMQETKQYYFSPNKKVTRGELALYIYRLEQYYAKQAELMKKNPVYNGSDSIIAHFYGDSSIMDTPLYLNAKTHALRSTINETYTVGGGEGISCVSYNEFSLCAAYFTDAAEITSIRLDGNGFTLADLEYFTGQEIDITVYDEDGPMPYSFDFAHEGIGYWGELMDNSKDSEVSYMFVYEVMEY